MSSTLEASVLMERNTQKIYAPSKIQETLTMKRMFDISEKFVVGQSNEIFGVTLINWEDLSWKQLSLVGDEEIISLSHAKVYVFSNSVFVLWKDAPEPTIKYCLG